MEKNVMTIGSHVPLSTLAKLFQTGEWSVALSDDVEDERHLNMEDETQKGNETNRIDINFETALPLDSQNPDWSAWKRKLWNVVLFVLPTSNLKHLFSTTTFLTQLIAPRLKINTLRNVGGVTVIVGITILFTDYSPMMKRPALPVDEGSNSTLANVVSGLVDIHPYVVAYDITRQGLADMGNYAINQTKDLYSKYKVGSFDAIERGLKKQENYTQLLEYIQQVPADKVDQFWDLLSLTMDAGNIHKGMFKIRERNCAQFSYGCDKPDNYYPLFYTFLKATVDDKIKIFTNDRIKNSDLFVNISQLSTDNTAKVLFTIMEYDLAAECKEYYKNTYLEKVAKEKMTYDDERQNATQQYVETTQQYLELIATIRHYFPDYNHGQKISKNLHKLATGSRFIADNTDTIFTLLEKYEQGTTILEWSKNILAVIGVTQGSFAAVMSVTTASVSSIPPAAAVIGVAYFIQFFLEKYQTNIEQFKKDFENGDYAYILENVINGVDRATMIKYDKNVQTLILKTVGICLMDHYNGKQMDPTEVILSEVTGLNRYFIKKPALGVFTLAFKDYSDSVPEVVHNPKNVTDAFYGLYQAGVIASLLSVCGVYFSTSRKKDIPRAMIQCPTEKGSNLEPFYSLAMFFGILAFNPLFQMKIVNYCKSNTFGEKLGRALFLLSKGPSLTLDTSWTDQLEIDRPQIYLNQDKIFRAIQASCKDKNMQPFYYDQDGALYTRIQQNPNAVFFNNQPKDAVVFYVQGNESSLVPFFKGSTDIYHLCSIYCKNDKKISVLSTTNVNDGFSWTKTTFVDGEEKATMVITKEAVESVYSVPIDLSIPSLGAFYAIYAPDERKYDKNKTMNNAVTIVTNLCNESNQGTTYLPIYHSANTYHELNDRFCPIKSYVMAKLYNSSYRQTHYVLPDLNALTEEIDVKRKALFDDKTIYAMLLNDPRTRDDIQSYDYINDKPVHLLWVIDPIVILKKLADLDKTHIILYTYCSVSHENKYYPKLDIGLGKMKIRIGYIPSFLPLWVQDHFIPFHKQGNMNPKLINDVDEAITRDDNQKAWANYDKDLKEGQSKMNIPYIERAKNAISRFLFKK